MLRVTVSMVVAIAIAELFTVFVAPLLIDDVQTRSMVDMSFGIAVGAIGMTFGLAWHAGSRERW